jgi:hypothetical protein
MRMKICLLAFLVYAPLAAAQTSGVLSRAQARALVVAHLQAQGYKTESAEFAVEDNPDDKDTPDYYLFDAYNNTRTRVSSLGAFAVDRKSATLWQRVSCEQVTTDAVVKLQSKLRRENGLRESDTGNEADSSPCY